MDGGQRQGRGVQGVDAQVGRTAGMSAAADEPDALGYGPVVGAADAKVLVAAVAGGVHHHRQVDVVELAKPDHLRFAAEKFNLALLPQPVPVFDFDVFLGGDSHEHQAAAEGGEHVRLHQGHGGPQHHGYLAMVPAGVGRSRLRVGMGVLVHDQRVQLSQDGQGGACRASNQVGADPGDGQPRPERNAHLGEGPGHQVCSLGLAEPRLRVFQDGLGQADDFVGPVIDFLEDPPLQVFFGRRGRSHETPQQKLQGF